MGCGKPLMFSICWRGWRGWHFRVVLELVVHMLKAYVLLGVLF